MISIDYLSDLGLKGSRKSSSGTDSNFNIILDYVIDATSTEVEIGDLLTFVGDKVKGAEALDIINCIALESGVVGQAIKCQIYGIVNIPNHFLVGDYYFNNDGVLSDVQNGEYIGLAITDSELLLKEGVFIND